MQATEVRPTTELADPPAGAPRRPRRKSLLAAALVVVALTGGGVAVRAVDANHAQPHKPLPSGLFSGIDAERDGVDATGSVPTVTTAPIVDPAFAGGTGD